jgi:hypothetical protein
LANLLLICDKVVSAFYFDDDDSCTTDADCKTDDWIYCESGTCQHKELFPLYNLEIGGTIVLTLLMALAVMSGIGGGGIIVPLLEVFYKLDIKNAVACSGFTILTGSITRYLITLKERHPDKDATCIDYGATNVMLPAVLVGSTLGVFFNLIFPKIITTFCLTLLLLFLTVQSSFKLRQVIKKENAKLKAAQEGKLDDKDSKQKATDREKVVN